MTIRRTPLASLLLLALSLAGCDAERGPIGPAPSGPDLSLSTASPAAGQYLVLFRGKGIPAGFDADVAKLGGSVVFRHAGLGLAAVGGIDAQGAEALGAIKGVSGVAADAEVALGTPRSAPRQALAGISVQSATNPASAILSPWQWNMAAIHADAAWRAGKLGSPDVTVAILDTGIDYDNLDLNGLVDLGRSISFVPTDDALLAALFPTRHPISDLNGHGTNVAQQVSSNAVVFAGVTSRTTLMGVKVLGANGSGSVVGILSGLLWAADNGADVINLSLGGLRLKAGGGGQFNAIVNSVLNYVNRQGALLVAAAGNDAIDLDHGIVPLETGELVHVPSLEYDYCTDSHVICVAAVGPTSAGGAADLAAVYTNYGRSAVSVAGPGGNIGPSITTWPWGDDQLSWVWSLCSVTKLAFNEAGQLVGVPCISGDFVTAAVGTSQATPHVSGLAALLIAEGRKNRPSQIKSAIMKGAVDVGQPGTDPFFGKGRIDVAQSLGLE